VQDGSREKKRQRNGMSERQGKGGRRKEKKRERKIKRKEKKRETRYIHVNVLM